MIEIAPPRTQAANIQCGLPVMPDRSLEGLDPATVRLLILPGGDIWEGSHPRTEIGPTLKTLRSDTLTRSIPGIAVTASVMSTQQNDVLMAGFDALESKPVSMIGLLRKMRALLDRQSAPSVST